MQTIFIFIFLMAFLHNLGVNLFTQLIKNPLDLKKQPSLLNHNCELDSLYFSLKTKSLKNLLFSYKKQVSSAV